MRPTPDAPLSVQAALRDIEIRLSSLESADVAAARRSFENSLNALEHDMKIRVGIAARLSPNDVFRGGTAHIHGYVPDPGATAGPGAILHADGTWSYSLVEDVPHNRAGTSIAQRVVNVHGSMAVQSALSADPSSPGSRHPAQHPPPPRVRGRAGRLAQADDHLRQDLRKITVTPTAGTFHFWINGRRWEKTRGRTRGTHTTTTGKHYFYYDAAGTSKYTTGSGASGPHDHPSRSRLLEQRSPMAPASTSATRPTATWRPTTTSTSPRLTSSSPGTTSGLHPRHGLRCRSHLRSGGRGVRRRRHPLRFRRSHRWGHLLRLQPHGGKRGLDLGGVSGFPFAFGTTYPSYNQWTGATWQLTELGGGTGVKYVNYFICATTAVTPAAASAFFIPGQTEHTTLAAAAAESLQSLSLGTLPFEEIAPLYKVTMAAHTSYGGTHKAQIISISILKNQTVTVTGGAVGITDHGNLTGLLDNDHPQYVLDAGDTMTGALVIPDLGDTTPSIYFTGDTNTGIAYETADQWVLLANGAPSLRVGNGFCTTGGTHYFNDANF